MAPDKRTAGRLIVIDTTKLIGEALEIVSGVGRVRLKDARVLVGTLLQAFGIESDAPHPGWSDSALEGRYVDYRNEVADGTRLPITPQQVCPTWRDVRAGTPTAAATRPASPASTFDRELKAWLQAEVRQRGQPK